MTIDAVRFPEIVEAGMEGGPEWNTDVAEMTSGAEKRNARWSMPRYKWNIGTGIRDQAAIDTLLAFFNARQGRAYGFLFKDWADYAATDQNIGTGTGALTTFQLRKAYTSGARTLYRKITRPVSGSVSIKVNGVTIASPSNWSVSTTTGIVTFNSAPTNGHAVTASFEFDVPVRFESDHFPVTLEAVDVGFVGDLAIVEVRE
jgi:uncharacterized protein (TIGR02217 family)